MHQRPVLLAAFALPVFAGVLLLMIPLEAPLCTVDFPVALVASAAAAAFGRRWSERNG